MRIKVTFSSSFKKAFKKKIKNNKRLEQKFLKALKKFIDNPFSPQLRTHKLTGILKELWSFRIDYEIRVIFYFVENGKGAVFIDIGRHDEVY